MSECVHACACVCVCVHACVRVFACVRVRAFTCVVWCGVCGFKLYNTIIISIWSHCLASAQLFHLFAIYIYNNFGK